MDSNTQVAEEDVAPFSTIEDWIVREVAMPGDCVVVV